MYSTTNLRKNADKILATYHASKKALKLEKRERKGAASGVAACQEAVVIIQRIAQKVHKMSHTHIASVVTR